MEERADTVYRTMVRCIEKNKMLTADEPVIACVSGGCDSTALLLLLDRYGKEYGHPLLCAHFNHMLRGADADVDCLFVRELCDGLGIPFYSEQGDVARFAEEHGFSLEDAARQCRYAYFEKLAEQYHAKIAVAHNKNDKIETVLLNLARGTGVHGLRGISYIRGNIIRPLLDADRTELELVCASYGVDFRTDSTNLQPFCKRNRIRLEILPFLREHLDSEIDEKLYRLSMLAADEDAFMQAEAGKIFEPLCECTSTAVTVRDRTQYIDVPAAIRRCVCVMILTAVKDIGGVSLFPGGQGISFSLIDRLDRFLLHGVVGDSVSLTRGIFGRVYHDRTVFSVGCQNHLSEVTLKKSWRQEIVPCDYETVISLCQENGETIAAFDYDKLEQFCLERACRPEFRTRQAGDIFTPYKAPGGKRLKKFLIDEKIPADQRNAIPLLACKNEILWIYGIRRSNIATIDKNTTTAIIFSAENRI